MLNPIPIPGFQRDPAGRPLIAQAPAALYAYGDLIRRCEQLILDQFSRGLVSGTTHTCIGQELAAMCVVRALDHPEDGVLSNHRNHGHFLTYAGDFVGLVAEIMGREGGVCRGRGGSQHLAWRHFHSNGVQGGMTAIGVGMALARKRRDQGDGSGTGMVAAMIGDGTLGQGLLYEAMNLASVWDVPMLFVVENNNIAQTTETRHTIGGGNIEARGAAFGLPTWRFDDADPALFSKVAEVVAELREQGGPGFLVLDTRRLGPHSKGDDLRDSAEMDEIRNRDPLQALGRRLDAAERAIIDESNAAFIEEVREAAGESPEASFDEVPQHIFTAPAVDSELSRSLTAPPPGSNVRQAINHALGHLLRESEETLVLGEDLHDPYGGAFKVTVGLSSSHPGRVLSTPISEAGITGAAIGLASEGMRPVMEVMFADFLSLCIDQLYNHAVKFPGMFDDTQVPLVIRSPGGGRRGYGPTHSQSPENLITSIPGLTVVAGSHRHAVHQLLVDAVTRWPYPLVFLEHKLLYGETQEPGDYQVLNADPDDPGATLFPTLIRRRPEPDLCIVTFGGMLPEVEQAVARLEAEEELVIDVMVPSLLAPFPAHTLVPALLDYPRIVVAEESHHTFGVSAEILASLLEAGYRGEVLRIGTPPVPIASARSLERHIIPDSARLFDDIIDLF